MYSFEAVGGASTMDRFLFEVVWFPRPSTLWSKKLISGTPNLYLSRFNRRLAVFRHSNTIFSVSAYVLFPIRFTLNDFAQVVAPTRNE